MERKRMRGGCGEIWREEKRGRVIEGEKEYES